MEVQSHQREIIALSWQFSSIAFVESSRLSGGEFRDNIIHTVARLLHVNNSPEARETSSDKSRGDGNCHDRNACSLEVEGEGLGLLVESRLCHSVTDKFTIMSRRCCYS